MKTIHKILAAAVLFLVLPTVSFALLTAPTNCTITQASNPMQATVGCGVSSTHAGVPPGSYVVIGYIYNGVPEPSGYDILVDCSSFYYGPTLYSIPYGSGNFYMNLSGNTCHFHRVVTSGRAMQNVDVYFTIGVPAGTINVSSNISSSWTITGPTTITGSGTSQPSPSQPAGAYTISWGSVSGYTAPATQSLTLISGGTITFNGTYTALTCANGAVNYPACTTNASGQCINGANNPPSCSQCADGMAYTGSFCVACSNSGCAGAGGSTSNPNGSLICNNGTSNVYYCSSCPVGYTLVSGACVANCTNGGTNPPTCTLTGTSTPVKTHWWQF